jgi:hypothetical protein
MTDKSNKELDKFYTKPNLSESLIKITKNVLKTNDDTMFLEPSAGSGSFSNLLKNCEAYDIKPEGPNIIEADFLNLELNRYDYVTIGNPPFGPRSKLAIQFFEKCSKHSTAIAMILPITFMKWSVQSKLNNSFKLIYSQQLEDDSFTFEGDDFSVKTCFQIWTKKSEYLEYKDLRLKSKPKTSHPDFLIWQHNATKESRIYLEEDWEYAVYRQGYKNYNKIFTKINDYEFIKNQIFNTNDQFFFIKPLKDKAKETILKMNFDLLSKRNMRVPGFGKADFVQYYNEF